MRSYRGPNSENRETSLERRRADPGPRADHLAEARAPRVTGHLEGDRRRHAAWAGRLPRRRQGAGDRRRSPRATAPRSAASSRSPTSCASSSTTRSATWSGSPPTSTTARRTSTSPAARSSPTSRRFYEFVSGPLHAGGFGPNELDDTFGPRVVFTKNPEGRANAAPTGGGLYFGHVKIDGKSGVMTVSHRDLAGSGSPLDRSDAGELISPGTAPAPRARDAERVGASGA